MNRIRISRITRRRQRGSAMVELAILLPVLLGLVMGVADFGRITYYSVAVNNAARAGAQYGLRDKYVDTAGMVQAAVNDASDISNFSAANVAATHYCECPGGGGTVACTMDACAGETAGPYVYVDVTTNYTFTTLMDFSLFGVPKSVTLTGRARLRAR